MADDTDKPVPTPPPRPANLGSSASTSASAQGAKSSKSKTFDIPQMPAMSMPQLHTEDTGPGVQPMVAARRGGSVKRFKKGGLVSRDVKPRYGRDTTHASKSC